MDAINITKARANLFKIIAQVNEHSKPVILTNTKGKNAVLISEDDRNALQETIYLNSIPGMADLLKKGMATPLAECVAEKDVLW